MNIKSLILSSFRSFAALDHSQAPKVEQSNDQQREAGVVSVSEAHVSLLASARALDLFVGFHARDADNDQQSEVGCVSIGETTMDRLTSDPDSAQSSDPDSADSTEELKPPGKNREERKWEEG